MANTVSSQPSIGITYSITDSSSDSTLTESTSVTRSIVFSDGTGTGLVNMGMSASGYLPSGGFITKDFKSLIDTNVIGAFNVAQESSKIMIKQKMGNIVNMTSIAADIGGAGELVHYAMSKGAIDSLTYGMAKELGVYGIRVNAVAPGLIATDIHEKAGDASRVERLMPSVPLGRVGLAKEVADTVMWLLSEKSSYVCGTIIRISGGRWSFTSLGLIGL